MVSKKLSFDADDMAFLKGVMEWLSKHDMPDDLNLEYHVCIEFLDKHFKKVIQAMPCKITMKGSQIIGLYRILQSFNIDESLEIYRYNICEKLHKAVS